MKKPIIKDKTTIGINYIMQKAKEENRQLEPAMKKYGQRNNIGKQREFEISKDPT